MQVKDVMSTKITVIRTNNTLQEAASQMGDLGVGDLPVVLNNEAVGFITDRDITVRAVAHGLDVRKAKVSDAMSEGIMVCREEDDIQSAIRTMADQKVRRLAVMDDNQKLTGILSLSDVAAHADDRLAKEVLQGLAK